MAPKNPHHEADPKAIEDYQENGKKVGKFFRPRGLNIVWGQDARYWNVPADQNGDKPVELLQVCWLEVTGSADVDPRKEYDVIFTLSLTADAFGWDGCPVYVMVKKGDKGKFASKKYHLTGVNDPKEFSVSSMLAKANPESKDAKLYFGLYEVWTGKWKGGLQIHKVIVKEQN